MDLKDFISGTYQKQDNYKAFLPALINHPWVWTDARLNILLEEANKSLGELNALSLMIPNVNLFIRMYIIKEATDSSRIEGTKTNIDEALLEKEQVTPENIDDWEEVQNYIKAMYFAIESLPKLPLSSRLLKETHAVLMRGVRGESKAPGQFRKVQNWIGGNAIADAKFVPPAANQILELISDLEKFINNSEIHVPNLIKIAIAHYQFETIHPFLDGNGRTGRLLITLYLIANNILIHPILYLSDYLEKNRREYFDYLDLARTKNDLLGWIKFFLSGVIDTSIRSANVLKNILALKEELDLELKQFGRRHQSATIVLNYLFSYPVISVSNITTIDGITDRTLRSVLNDFSKFGILKETTGLKKNRIFMFERYLNLFRKLHE